MTPWLGATAPAAFDLWRAGNLWAEKTGWFAGMPLAPPDTQTPVQDTQTEAAQKP